MPRKKLPIPFRPPVRPAAPPQACRMLGETAGRIPAEHPKDWVAMRMLGDPAETIHAVPAGNSALCGEESRLSWVWQRGHEITCQRCSARLLEEELENDRTVRWMRYWGITGPITRQDYLDWIHAPGDPQEPSAEMESMLPTLLRDWDQFDPAK
jgi:hypothetical protein